MHYSKSNLQLKAKCGECGRRPKGAKDAAGWNCTLVKGIITGYTCPDCQTVEQDLEAAVNAALLDYHVRNGRFYGIPKGGAA